MSSDGSKVKDNSASNSQDNETLIEIQTRLEFQDLTIAELNEIITDQQRQLDKLNARLELLSDKLNIVEESAEISQGNEKPPHY